MRLPYFNVVRFLVVDPMHNLLPGIAKDMLTIWKDFALINDESTYNIHEHIQSITTPASSGRIPDIFI